MAFFDQQIAQALGREYSNRASIVLNGQFQLSSIFDVSGLAVSALSAAADELAMLVGAKEISIDRELSEYWFGMTLRPTGWTIPGPWDAIAGNYRAKEGWVRLHTNVPAHRAAALLVLKVEAEREKVRRAIANWDMFELEDAIINAGGVAAAMRGMSEWAAHQQGQSVAAEPLIKWNRHEGAARTAPVLTDGLNGLRVLDLTRVLAGPVATRFLAGFGASVLRIDPPMWNEDGIEPEVTIGKACAGLDLWRRVDRSQFEKLLKEAHVLVHGYRPGALDGLGYDETRRRALNPGLIDVSLSAYGWNGPWKSRRGFDTIVQMNTGLAHESMVRAGSDKPVALPVQALDHATGYLMAAAVLRAVRKQIDGGGAFSARLSLARTAQLLICGGINEPIRRTTSDNASDENFEQTYWGPAMRKAFPVKLDGRGPKWGRQAGPLRMAPPEWP